MGLLNMTEDFSQKALVWRLWDWLIRQRPKIFRHLGQRKKHWVAESLDDWVNGWPTSDMYWHLLTPTDIYWHILTTYYYYLEDQIHKSGGDNYTTNSETKKRSCYERLIRTLLNKSKPSTDNVTTSAMFHIGVMYLTKCQFNSLLPIMFWKKYVCISLQRT